MVNLTIALSFPVAGTCHLYAVQFLGIEEPNELQAAIIFQYLDSFCHNVSFLTFDTADGRVDFTTYNLRFYGNHYFTVVLGSRLDYKTVVSSCHRKIFSFSLYSFVLFFASPPPTPLFKAHCLLECHQHYTFFCLILYHCLSLDLLVISALGDLQRTM